MAEKDKQIKGYIAEHQPNDAVAHVIAYAFCKVMYGATQKAYANEAGFSDRQLRQFISNNKELYEEELTRLEELDTDKPNFDILANRTITEEQLDNFVDALFKSAVSGNARDKQLFIEFTGLTSEQVLTLNKNKAKSLRYWIRGELDSISSYIDTKTLGIMSESSELIFRGDKGSKNNTQNYINKDVADESFALELMYWGAVHLNLLNGVEHPDTSLLATAVRVDRLEKDVAETFNKAEVKKYAKGEAITEGIKNVTEAEWIEKLSGTFSPEEIEDILYKKRMAQASKPTAPEVVRADVEQRASKHEDELRVLLTAQEEMAQALKEMAKHIN